MNEILEPFAHDGELNMAIIEEGCSIDYLSSSEWWDENKNDKKYLEKIRNVGLEYRWSLPDRISKDNLPKDLPDIHRRIGLCLRKYLWLADDDAYDLIANWIISTYFREQFKTLPILIFDGVTISGKSTAMKILKELVYHGEMVTNASAAAIAREIMDYDTTILIDEALDNLNSDRGGEIYNMIKSCFDRNGMWIRADPKGRKNYKYLTYTNMAVSIKGDCLPDDVYNRGIRINMTGMPEGTEIGDIENCDEDEDFGPICTTQIRTELYSLRAITIAYPNHPNVIDFRPFIMQTKSHLTMKCEDGRWLYAYCLDMPADSPSIRNRDRKIASTLYSIGLATMSERAIVDMIIKNAKNNSEMTIDTPEALTFMALFELLEDGKVNMGPICAHMDRNVFCTIMGGISTTDVADRYNLILIEQGNATKDKVMTKVITAKLNALGLTYRRGNGNKSYMCPTDISFIPNFLKNLNRYSPRDLGRYRLLIGDV